MIIEFVSDPFVVQVPATAETTEWSGRITLNLKYVTSVKPALTQDGSFAVDVCWVGRNNGAVICTDYESFVRKWRMACNP